MNGAGLTTGSVAGSRAGGDGRIMGAEAGVHSKLAEVGGLWKVTEGGLMRSWVDKKMFNFHFLKNGSNNFHLVLWVYSTFEPQHYDTNSFSQKNPLL